MTNNTMTILKKELARFFGDKRMVVTTILMPGILIYVIYSFMGTGMMHQFSTKEDYRAKAYVQNMPEELAKELAALSADWTDIREDQAEEIREKIQEKEADVLVVFPQDFISRVEDYEPASGDKAPNVEIYYNSTESESQKIYGDVSDILNDYEASLANKLDVNAGEQIYDCASKEDVTGQLFSMLLPMLMMIFLYSGCVAVAPEAIAGEKERGTIATLLVTPMKRSSLALGKILSLSIIALLSGISSFVGTIASLPKLMGGDLTGVDSAVYGVTDYGMLLGIILSTVLVLVSVISVISAFSKSVKEAGTAVSSLMVLVMFVGLTPIIMGGGPKPLYLYLIPLYNSVQCMHGVFSFTGEPVQVAVTIAANLLFAGIMTYVLKRLFDSEKAMFSR